MHIAGCSTTAVIYLLTDVISFWDRCCCKSVNIFSTKCQWNYYMVINQPIQHFVMKPFQCFCAHNAKNDLSNQWCRLHCSVKTLGNFQLFIISAWNLALHRYLQSGVDIEASSGWIHAGNILRIVDFFQAQFLPVIPGGGKKINKREKNKNKNSDFFFPPCFFRQ